MGESKNRLRDRCFEFLIPFGCTDNDSVDELQAFVMAEVARKAAPNFETSPALAIFFATREDRDGFVQLWKQAHPEARTIEVDP